MSFFLVDRAGLLSTTFFLVPGKYRGWPAEGDRRGEGGHPQAQVLPTDQEGWGHQDS